MKSLTLLQLFSHPLLKVSIFYVLTENQILKGRPFFLQKHVRQDHHKFVLAASSIFNFLQATGELEMPAVIRKKKKRLREIWLR